MFLLRPDLPIVVTVGGVLSRALLRRVGSADAFGTLDRPPPTARGLRIEAEQEGLVNPIST